MQLVNCGSFRHSDSGAGGEVSLNTPSWQLQRKCETKGCVVYSAAGELGDS